METTPRRATARRGLALAITFAAAAALPAAASAAAGDLDPSFGGDGIVALGSPATPETTRDVAVQPDGRIVIVGRQRANAGEPAVHQPFLERRLPDGQPDASIAASAGYPAGRVPLGPQSADADVRAVLLQPDGKIVAVTRFDGRGVAIRLHPDGTPDHSFGNAGRADLGDVDPRDVELLPDGRLLVAALNEAAEVRALVWRLLPDGRRDTSFGYQGAQLLETTHDESYPVQTRNAQLGLEPDGRIIVAVTQERVGTSAVIVHRRLPDGARDPSYGLAGGFSLIAGLGSATANALAMRPDRSVVVVGAEFGAKRSLLGMVDPDDRWSGDGSFIYGVDDADSRFDDVAVDASSRLVMAGTTQGADGSTFVTVRRAPKMQESDTYFVYNDPAWVGGSRRELRVDARSEASGVALQPDGRIVVVGTGQHDGVSQGFIARLQTDPPAGPGGGGGGGGTSDSTAPAISKGKLRPTRFRVAKNAKAISAKRRRRGTTLTLTLSEAATVTGAVERRTTGRRSGKRCVAPRKGLRKSCTRWVAAGTLVTLKGKAGANRAALTGRVGRRALKAGRYRLRLRATDAAGNRSKVGTVGFRVTKG